MQDIIIETDAIKAELWIWIIDPMESWILRVSVKSQVEDQDLIAGEGRIGLDSG